MKCPFVCPFKQKIKIILLSRLKTVSVILLHMFFALLVYFFCFRCFTNGRYCSSQAEKMNTLFSQLCYAVVESSVGQTFIYSIGRGIGEIAK